MKKVLIIGSKGFIGGYSQKYFRKKGLVTYGCDIVFDYNDPEYFLVDAIHSDYSEIFQLIKFDFCINCSGSASVPKSMTNPATDFDLNVNIVVKLLDAIRRFNPKCKFINLSSAAVYGNPVRLPVSENQPTEPVSPYGYHKKISEDILKEYCNLFGTRSCSLRIFSAYGDGLKKQLFWDLFNKLKARDDKIALYGTGNESRDFIHITDILQAIDIILKNTEFKGECINVANGEEIRIREIVDIFISKLGWQGIVEFKGTTRKGDPVNWRADISKLGKMGYTKSIDLEKGVNNYIEWIKELKSD